MRQFLEGSMAVAKAVGLSRPHVICAYPITPQTHIVEDLAQMVADGELKSEFINVESEFAAASVCLGASAAGSRSYTATSSQGLLLMAEVIFNIAGLRLPNPHLRQPRRKCPPFYLERPSGFARGSRCWLDSDLRREQPGMRRRSHPGIQDC